VDLKARAKSTERWVSLFLKDCCGNSLIGPKKFKKSLNRAHFFLEAEACQIVKIFRQNEIISL
jgi:hypothetical protein